MESSTSEKIHNRKSFRHKPEKIIECERREKSQLKRIKRHSREYGRKMANTVYHEFFCQTDKSIEALRLLMNDKLQMLLLGQKNYEKGKMILKMQERINAFKEKCEAIITDFDLWPEKLTKLSIKDSEIAVKATLAQENYDTNQMQFAEQEFTKNGYAPFRDQLKDTQVDSLYRTYVAELVIEEDV